MSDHNDLINALLRRRLDGTSTEEIMASAATALRHMQQEIVSLTEARNVLGLDLQCANKQNELLQRGLVVLNSECESLRAKRAAIEKQYIDIITQVACKFPGETRHDTAKRYIVERETREVAGPCQEAGSTP